MPVTPTYPGVYLEEISSGVRTIVGVSTSITAFVGSTARSPVNRATRVLNFGDFEQAFGGLHRDSEVGYAIQQFFLNGGTDAYVVRTATGVARAAIGLRFGVATGGDALTLQAANEGDWDNLLRVSVDYNTANPDSSFNLTATGYERQGDQFVPMDSEQFRNLSMNSRSPAYTPAVIAAGSGLITAAAAPALAFSGRGTSQSGDLLNGALNTFTPLTAQETALSGILDGSNPFTLVLSNSTAIADVGDLVTALGAAITAGLAARLQAPQVDEQGASDAAGRHVLLRSHNVAANPNTADQFSSVQIVTALANDVSRKLKLGLTAGGREREGAANRRLWPPAPSAPTSPTSSAPTWAASWT